MNQTKRLLATPIVVSALTIITLILLKIEPPGPCTFCFFDGTLDTPLIIIFFVTRWYVYLPIILISLLTDFIIVKKTATIDRVAFVALSFVWGVVAFATTVYAYMTFYYLAIHIFTF